ncbi:MAG: arginase family protein [Syntrophaceae bacterium]|nr:arginase family protein [Syntrophaceae bacterium]
MHNDSKKKIIFLGCPLDGDERHDSIQEKLALKGARGVLDDPYDGIMEILRQEADPDLWIERGSIDLPGWLRPIPSISDQQKITTKTFVDFMDQGGYESYARQVGDLIASKIFPDIPCLLAVDHSLTGGAFKKLVELYKPKDVSLVVLDSHTDAIPMSVMAGMIQYDIETNPETVHDRNDPFLYDRPDSYNASSFLYYLLAEGVLKPQNLYLIGINDYPPKHAFRIKDPRIKNYVNLFSELKRRGVTLLTKNDFLVSPSKIKNILTQIQSPYVYISIDMDIGARNGVEGVRFLERQGMNEIQIYRLIEFLRTLLWNGIRLAGMDLTEFNPRRALSYIPPREDQTYRIGANIIKKLLWER